MRNEKDGVPVQEAEQEAHTVSEVGVPATDRYDVPLTQEEKGEQTES